MFLHDVQMVSVGLTATTSDHLPQFSFVSNILSNPSTQKSSYHKRDWSKFNQENFILDYLDKDLHDVPQIDQQNFNLSMDSLLNNMNSILDVHAPLKKVNKYKLKFKTKPWITSALQKSISIKNNLLKKNHKCSKRSSNKREVSQRNIKTTETCFLQFSNKAKLTTTIIILKLTGAASKTYGKIFSILKTC